MISRFQVRVLGGSLHQSAYLCRIPAACSPASVAPIELYHDSYHDQLDTIYGDKGDDTTDGQAGTDTLYGGPGNDRIFDRSGNDNRIYAGDGQKDLICVNRGSGEIVTYDRRDKFIFNESC